MDLYFAPLACSMATRIAIHEAGASANFICVDIHTDPHSRPLIDGTDYFAINPMGQVPAVRTNDGSLLTENPVVLQYVADLYPAAGLAPRDGMQRYRLQEWLNFIGTELHKATFIPLLGRDNPEEVKAFARQKMALRFGRLGDHLGNHEFLLDRFTVADAYLITVLNWAPYAGVDLSGWPAVKAYYERMKKRPSVARAMAEEAEAYSAEQARRTSSVTTGNQSIIPASHEQPVPHSPIPTPTTDETATVDVLRRFNDVFQKHDPTPLTSLVADDCVIENTQPAPNGSRHVGQSACVELWTQIATAPGTFFVLEDVFVTGDRGIILWRFHWGPDETSSVRGVNLMRVQKGRIVEALGYVKGD